MLLIPIIIKTIIREVLFGGVLRLMGMSLETNRCISETILGGKHESW